jgi:hypothetical protein
VGLSAEHEAIERHRVFVQAEQVGVFEGFCEEEAGTAKSGQEDSIYVNRSANVPCHAGVESLRVLRIEHRRETSVTGVGSGPLFHSFEHLPSTLAPYIITCCPPKDVHRLDSLCLVSVGKLLNECSPPVAGDNLNQF